MSPLHLFKLVSQHNHWLSVRQSAIATNVANVNTPGFKALEVKPFDAMLDGLALNMTFTSERHIAPAGGAELQVTDGGDQDGVQVLHSGNTVALEQEMMKAGEVNRAYALNAAVVKAFHRMLLASTKG
jgi:flagellar basal-body rod protein FlgB